MNPMLFFWRYNFSGGHTTSSGTYVNRCQTYQTSDYFLVWGINEDLRASTLKISLNNETFIEDLSQELYFIKVYPLNGEFPDTISCSFYNKNHENIFLLISSNLLVNNNTISSNSPLLNKL